MSVSIERFAIVLTLMLAGSLLPACKKSAEMTPPGDASSADVAQTPPDPLVELEQLEGRMRELGLTPARPGAAAGIGIDNQAPDQLEEEKVGEAGEKPEDLEANHRVDGEPQPEEIRTSPSPMAERDDLHAGVNRCTSVCELSEAICELEVRICSMATNHDGDPTYANACERAVDDCELSGDACDTCVE